MYSSISRLRMYICVPPSKIHMNNSRDVTRVCQMRVICISTELWLTVIVNTACFINCKFVNYVHFLTNKYKTGKWNFLTTCKFAVVSICLGSQTTNSSRVLVLEFSQCPQLDVSVSRDHQRTFSQCSSCLWEFIHDDLSITRQQHMLWLVPS